MRSVLLLISFPVLLLSIGYVVLLAISYWMDTELTDHVFSWYWINETFIPVSIIILLFVSLWFLIAWIFHASMIRRATCAKPLERSENLRVYNLTENLCIQIGMKMPAINIIEDESLNAFASGIDQRTYAITVSRGLIDELDDDELEAVIAHEITHIRNGDVRLLIISIIFVGIFAFITEAVMRLFRSDKSDRGGVPILLIIMLVSAVAYFISLLLRFGISRSREYLADAGSAELTKRPYALAMALRKINEDPSIEAVQREDVAQLFIEHPKLGNRRKFGIAELFATHPPIERRIEILEQFI